MSETVNSNPSEVKHLVVMIHGFWGSPSHLNHLQWQLLQTHPDAGIKVIVPESNRNDNTYDGIEVGAERITHEILQKVDQMKQDGTVLERFSIVGYSLGGLIARYCVGLLFANAFFDSVDPVNFTTFASPHLGVRSPKTGYQVDTWNWLGSNLLSVSGQQLFLTDNFRNTNRPLLDILADPTSIFMKGLQRFEKRSVYANIQHDPAVPFYSAAISKHDPYLDLDAVNVHYLQLKDEEQQVILDPERPVTRKEEKEASLSQQQQGWLPQWTLSERTKSSLPFYAFAATVIPIGIPIFLANAGYQTYQSAARVKQHEKGDQMDLQRYRLPFLEETQRLQDAAIEGLSGASAEEYLPTSPSDSDDQAAEKDGWPTLALTPHQFTMVDNLDKVGFIKYPCFLQVRRAHAAMIVRSQTSTTFNEGKVVCKHWSQHFAT